MRRRALGREACHDRPLGASEVLEPRQDHRMATAVAAVPRCRSSAVPPVVPARQAAARYSLISGGLATGHPAVGAPSGVDGQGIIPHGQRVQWTKSHGLLTRSSRFRCGLG